VASIGGFFGVVVIICGLGLGLLVTLGVRLGIVAVYKAVCREKKLPPAPIVIPIISIKMAISLVQDFGGWGNSSKERIREISVSQLGQI
jgi:hypothetical protein